MITLVRVDDRLLHGQVIHGWVPATGSDTLVVVAGEETRDIYERELASMAGESPFEVLVLDLAGAVSFLKDRANRGRRVMVVLSSIGDALGLIEGGLKFSVLNIGNIHHAGYKTRLSPSVEVTSEEEAALARLRARGVGIDIRALPEPAGGEEGG